MKKIVLTLLVLAGILPVAWADSKINVVATQTIYADLVRTVGGDKVDVSSIVPPQYNIHFVQPRPSDVRRVTKADLYVNGGLDLEAWSDPLLEAAGRPQLFRSGERNVDLSEGIRLLEVPSPLTTRADGDIHLFGNPHIHMSPANIRIMAQTILKKLKEIDPAHADYYQANADNFFVQWDKKMAEWKGICAHCKGEEIIAYHEDIAYFAEFLGIKDKEYLEPKPGIPPTPKHMQFLENYAREHHVKAIVMPTYYPRGEAERIAKRLGIKVVTIAQGAGEVPGTETAVSFFDYNIKQISEALK